MKGEEDMAAKKAALLEKRMRRERETQERKQQQELDQEQKKEAARLDPRSLPSRPVCRSVSRLAPRLNPWRSSRLKAEEEQQKKEDEKARRDYIRNEYLRKKQLKLMDDMEEVIKPRSGSLKKKPRPKSIHRDVVDSSTPTVRAAGERRTHFPLHAGEHSQILMGDTGVSCRGPPSRLLRVQRVVSVSQSGRQRQRPPQQQEEQQVRSAVPR